jgi:hypothetical protein
MGFFNFIETSFFISLAITFILVFLLVYFFKQKLNEIENKSDAVVTIVGNIVKEVNILRQAVVHTNAINNMQQNNHINSESLYSENLKMSKLTPIKEVISNYSGSDEESDSEEDSDGENESNVDIEHEDEDGSEEENDSDEDDESESGDDSEIDSNSYYQIKMENTDIDLNTTSEIEFKHDFHSELTGENIDIDSIVCEDVENNTDTIDIMDTLVFNKEEIIVNDEIVDTTSSIIKPEEIPLYSGPEEIFNVNETLDTEEIIDNTEKEDKDQYKKMNIQQLKTIAVTKGLVTDANKLKKNELVRILENSHV